MVAEKELLLVLTVGLVTHSQDNFGGAVISGHNVGRHQEAGGGGSGQTEVQDLQGAVGLHHDVAGLQVLTGNTEDSRFRFKAFIVMCT